MPNIRDRFTFSYITAFFFLIFLVSFPSACTSMNSLLRIYNGAVTTLQFYLYGRSHFTRTGWENHVAQGDLEYNPDVLKDSTLSLRDRVYMITGANAGIGKEITRFLASKEARVYMVCRNPERGRAARDEIMNETSNPNIKLLLADVSLESDVRRLWLEFEEGEKNYCTSNGDVARPRLDGLVCNAGNLLHKKTLTKEGFESIFASHLLFGTYLLGQLAIPSLLATPNSRLVVTSSGGMYNSKFPAWDVASGSSLRDSEDPNTDNSKRGFDGQMAYVYAKRGQVLLCEEWAKRHPSIKFVSSHPGWVLTEALVDTYGDSRKWLEPLRTPWQGAEGIIWLLVEKDPEKIQNGGFYLDRKPQVKHISGPFFSEGSFTKNTQVEIDDMMLNLQKNAKI